jgi:hypothetical protein
MTEWYQADIQDAKSRNVCVLKGYYGAVFFIKHKHGEWIKLQRVRDNGIVVFETELPQLRLTTDMVIRAAVNEDNEIVVLAYAGSQLVVAHIAQYGQVLWTKNFTTTMWNSAGIAVSQHFVFLGASMEGTLTLEDRTYTDDGFALALTIGTGALYWGEKLMHRVSAVTVCGGVVYFAGSIGNTVVVQSIDTHGQRLALTQREMTSECVVHSALYEPEPSRGLMVAGLVFEDTTVAFQLVMNNSCCADENNLTTIQTNSDDATVELFEALPDILMHLSIPNEGSWIVNRGLPVHHFSDVHSTSMPRVAAYATQNPHYSLFLKGGSMEGQFMIDKSVYDVGRETEVAYAVQLLLSKK